MWATFLAPADATHGHFRLHQTTTTPGEQIGFQATAFMLEQARVAALNLFGDALTPGWRSDGELWHSASKSPGVSEEEIAAAILKRIPAGLIYDVVISDERDYDTVSRLWSTYDDLRAAGLAGYSDLLGGRLDE